MRPVDAPRSHVFFIFNVFHSPLFHSLWMFFLRCRFILCAAPGKYPKLMHRVIHNVTARKDPTGKNGKR